MADEQSTVDATEAPAEASVDTSTNDAAQDTDADVELEDMEISEEELGADETDEADASEPEKDEESVEDTEPASEEPSEEDDASEDAGKDEPEDDKSDKQRNDEYAKRRIAERQARERQKEVAQAQEDVRLEQYLKEAEGDEAELTKRTAEVERLLLKREKVSMNEDKLRIGIDRAVADIDLISKGSPEVREEMARAIDDFIAMYVETNQYGDPVAVHGDIYKFLQTKADSIRRIQGVGVRQAVQDKQANRSKTVPLPSRTPKEPKVDPDLADFDKSWD